MLTITIMICYTTVEAEIFVEDLISLFLLVVHVLINEI